MNPKQAKAVELILGGQSHAEAARELGCRRETVWKWTQTPEFATKLKSGRLMRRRRVGAILDSSVMDAVSLLRDLIVDDQAPAAARIKAAQMVLDRGGVGPSYTVEIENTAKTAEEMTPLQQALLIVEHYDAAKALILGVVPSALPEGYDTSKL